MATPATPDAKADTDALTRLAAQAGADLARIGETGVDWVPAAEGIDHDVVVVGAGQSGLSAAFGLRRAGIGRVSVVDAGNTLAAAE